MGILRKQRIRMSDNSVKSVVKALNILDNLAFEDIERNGIGLVDLAKKMDMLPNTLHNILKSLVICGYADQNEQGKYIVGRKFKQMETLSKLSYKGTVEKVFMPVMKGIKESTDETVILAVLLNGKRVQIAEIASDNPVRSKDSGNNLFSLISGICLAYLADEKQLLDIFKVNGYPEGAKDLSEAKSFVEKFKLSDCDVFQKTRYNKEIETFAIPFIYEDAIFSLGIHLPGYRCDEKKKRAILQALLEAKKSLS
jgi:DNA-binding IclR family transcriptional regulator